MDVEHQPTDLAVRLWSACRSRPAPLREVTAVDDGNGTGGGARPGGHGLLGMRERVSLFGGELRAGARPGGGFAVSARFPLQPTTG